ncbi:RmlC-like cupin domain-containing protein [Trametes elegans]|nr:RmlC-like cupin domain-containing protein [Trametes elegans]
MGLLGPPSMFRPLLPRLALAARQADFRQTRLSPRTFSTTMSNFHPNTDPPKGFTIFNNLQEVASESDKFRRVLWTGTHSQFVIMTVPADGEIGEEIHTVDQHLFFLSGNAQAIEGGTKTTDVHPGDVVIVPAGTKHNFKNSGPTPPIVATVYAPAEHKADTVHDSLEQGEKLEEEGKDEPPSWAKGKQ